MPQLTISEEQVLELLQQLSPEGKRKALRLLRSELVSEFFATTKNLSEHLRLWAKEQGVELDSLGDDEWEALVDAIIHKANSGGF
ncbi:MAG: hypothetical protein N3B10_00355 [Armatimonadetes bacterium]|nr:hypothetical protein [Armatimonadota bacterium]MCX7966920.1 hypothetical protein [Armatimonadota bacterium]MDW8141877.1 hypothetical protein [Armatimonadota bacterium]